MELGAISSLHLARENMSVKMVKMAADQQQQLVDLLAESAQNIESISSDGGLDVYV